MFGSRKFGGNAQSITKDRWIHHTSFLWDYDAGNMAYLKLPNRAPEYRLVCCETHSFIECLLSLVTISMLSICQIPNFIYRNFGNIFITAFVLVFPFCSYFKHILSIAENMYTLSKMHSLQMDIIFAFRKGGYWSLYYFLQCTAIGLIEVCGNPKLLGI